MARVVRRAGVIIARVHYNVDMLSIPTLRDSMSWVDRKTRDEVNVAESVNHTKSIAVGFLMAEGICVKYYTRCCVYASFFVFFFLVVVKGNLEESSGQVSCGGATVAA